MSETPPSKVAPRGYVVWASRLGFDSKAVSRVPSRDLGRVIRQLIREYKPEYVAVRPATKGDMP